MPSIRPGRSARLGVDPRSPVEVTSRRGSLTAPARVTADVAPSQVLLAFQFPDVAAELLTSDAADEVTY